MAKNTSNYNLKKPSPEDFYNVEDQNGNMDIIDQELERLNEDKAGVQHNHNGVYETPNGAQSKVDAAKVSANQYTDQKFTTINSDLSSHLSDTTSAHGINNKVNISTYNSHLSDYEYQTAIISGTQIRIARQSTTKRLFLNLLADLTGGNITVSLNGGITSAPLKDIDGNILTTLSKGYWEVVDNASFFTLRPKGGGFLDGWNETVTARAWENITKADPVMVKKMGTWEDGVNKLNNPTTLPNNNTYDVAVSPDGTYWAVAHYEAPFITIYKRNGDTFTKLAAPAVTPTGVAHCVAFSPDGNYLAVGHYPSPLITIYKRNEDTFIKLADPANLPADMVWGIAFSPNGNYLAVAVYMNTGASPLVIYKRNGDVFTKLADPASMPNGSGLGCAFSPDGYYLAVAHDSSPYITIYKRNGDTFTKLTTLTALPNTANDCAFSPDGVYLAVAHSGSPYFTMYKRSGDVFTKVVNPDTLPSYDGYSCTFSPDGNYLAVGHSSSPFITIYKRNGDVLTKVANPSTLPSSSIQGCVFSPDSSYLMITYTTPPYVTIYKSDVYDSIQKITKKNQYFSFSPPEWKFGVAMETKAAGETGKVNLFPKIYNMPNT